MLCLVHSRWRQTCASSSSHRTTSNRTPKGNGSSIPDTERTTSSPSFTEPSWSDVYFFLLQLSTLSQRNAAPGLCFFVWDLCFWLLLTGMTNRHFPPPPPPSYLWTTAGTWNDFCVHWKRFLDLHFPITLWILPPFHYVFLFLRKKPSMNY